MSSELQQFTDDKWLYNSSEPFNKATNYQNLQIVVINDGSTDQTEATIQQVIKENPAAAIIYEKIENGGKARALNKAITLATGEIVITIDADSVMHIDAIKNLVKHFADPEVASVAGNVAIGNRIKPIGLLQQLEYLYGFYFKRADSVMNAVYIVGGAAAAYRRQILIDIGGFDETIITEDIELSTRLQDQGRVIRYAADALVFTEGPSDFMSLCKQRLRWKSGRLVTFFRYRHLFFSFKKHHNKYLSFLVLPIALFAEALLFFEGVMLTVFYTYTIYTNDYMPLVAVIALLTVIITFQILSDPNMRHHLNLLLIAPGAWILFYVMDFVEYQALIKSLWNFKQKKKLTWQSWSRKGVFDAQK